MDCLRLGVLAIAVLCRSDVRTKLGINMRRSGVVSSDHVASKEERTGPEPKGSRSKLPCRAVVG